ncbi:MAG: translation elongation factor Ts [Planctomycetota bacterium]
MTISASLVRELRDKTGAAMMDCKKALEAVGGDMEAALDQLRKQGLKTAAKKAGRETSEGRVSSRISDDARMGAMVAVRCETDFVANTDDFGSMLMRYSATALAADLPEGEAADHFMSQTVGGVTVEEDLKSVIGRLGENIVIARVARIAVPDGYVATYVHHNHKVGALAAVRTDADRAKAEAFLGRLCQHIAFTKPAYAVPADVPADVIERERQVHLESEELASKPAEIREKIVEGKMKAFYKEVCLLEQGWIFDAGTSVQKAITSELGANASLAGYAVFEI